ncbi:MAG: amidase [Chromatiales bacterium]|nr:amidase [Chromatiales bacterium]
MINRREFVQTGLATAAIMAGPRVSSATTDVTGLTLRQASTALGRKALSPVDLTRACLDRITALQPRLNAFITVLPEQALADARERERELAGGRRRGPLHGIPVALKDNIDTAGIRTTAAAGGFAERIPAADAEVVRRLRESGAILLGKLNMDECAYGVTSTSGWFGAVKNPWSEAHVAGGSSGGPAAAVAAGLCYGALGTDTGGSIRQPAAWCGITGLKPTCGLVSARGVIPLSWSLDHVGPMARTAEDAALLLQAIAGFDPLDPASVESSPVDYARALDQSTRRLRIGLPREMYFEDLDPEIASAVTAAIELLRNLTAGTRDVTLPAVPNLSLLFVEAGAYLAPALAASPDGFSPNIRALVETGARISAASYAEARRQLALSRHAIRQVFDDVDVLVTPTTPDLPSRIDAGAAPARRGPPLSARNTTPFNIYGLPTISVCCGFAKSGLPIGLQISGPAFGDARVLALAHAYQQRTAWHERRPA